MKRSYMKRSTKPMRSRPKKRPKIDGIDYPGLCKDQPCFLLLPFVFSHSIDTVVPCHSNQSKHGKGLGRKADDLFTVPGCFACHYEIDQGKTMSKEEKFSAWDAAYALWSNYRETLLQQEKQP